MCVDKHTILGKPILINWAHAWFKNSVEAVKKCSAKQKNKW